MSNLEQRVSAIEQEVSGLCAINDLRGVLSQYAIGVDGKRPEILRAIFAEDAFIGVPAWDVEISGRDAILEFFAHYWGRFDNPQRYYANEKFEVNGERATAFMYWHLTQERALESVLGWGTYDWAFARGAGGWLITREIVHIQTMTTLAAGWAGRATPMQL